MLRLIFYNHQLQPVIIIFYWKKNPNEKIKYPDTTSFFPKPNYTLIHCDYSGPTLSNEFTSLNQISKVEADIQNFINKFKDDFNFQKFIQTPI